MSDCCSPEKKQTVKPGRHVCPVNGKPYLEVARKTILQHLNQPWLVNLPDQPYFFCDDADCDVVYFGLDDLVIDKSMLRTRVGIKEKADDAPVCYCFGVTRLQAMSDINIKLFVIEKTKNSLCACETRNPSGRCCLKDFPKE